VNLDVNAGSAKVGFYCTSAPLRRPGLCSKAGDQALIDEIVAINPRSLTSSRSPCRRASTTRLSGLALGGRAGTDLLPSRPPDIRSRASRSYSAASTAGGQTNEELYLIGPRARQFHDPNVDPLLYWREALRRDPGDTRVNAVLGIVAFGQPAMPTRRNTCAKRWSGSRIAILRRKMHGGLLPRRHPQSRRQSRRCVSLVLQGHLEPGLEGRRLLFACTDRRLARGLRRGARFRESLDRFERTRPSGRRISEPRFCAISAATRRPWTWLASASHAADPLDVRAMAETYLASRAKRLPSGWFPR